MLVSIIVPVYNGEKFLDRITNSLIGQTYKNIEILFQNDASTDNSLKKLNEISKKHPKKIKVASNKVNCGPGGTKSEGLKRATGEYILFVDCDDYISDDFIESLVEVAKNNNYPDVVTSNYTKVDEKGNIDFVRKFKNKDDALVQKVFSSAKLIKRSFLNENNITLPYGQVLEDVLFTSAIILANPTYEHSDNAGSFYVYNSESITHTVMKKFKEGAIEKGFEYIRGIKAKTNDERLIYFTYKFICWHLLKSGNNVGKEAMMNEYEKVFTFIKNEFPKYKKFKFSIIKHERLLVKFVLFNIMLLHKLHIDKIFFKLYSSINLERFWPNV